METIAENKMCPLTLIISVNVRHCIIYPRVVIPTLIISFALAEDSASHSRTLQLHLWVLQSFSPMHQHSITLRRALGASVVFEGDITGVREPSSLYHPCSGSSCGGFVFREFLQTAT
jgi:hypothetical protein